MIVREPHTPALGLYRAHGDRRVERLLGATGLFTRIEGFRGTLRVAGLEARVDVESVDCVRLIHVPVAAPRGADALALNARLAGNARLACTDQGTVLIADTELGDGTHLGQVLRGALESFARAVAAGNTRVETVPPLQEELVLEGLRETGLTEDDVVRLADGWELRPRLRGVVRSVRLAIHGRDVRLSRAVAEAHRPVPDEARTAVAADVALRINPTLRRARLALVDGVPVAEAWLTELELRGPRLIDAACAVASAADRARLPLELLSQNPDVADGYAGLFVSRCPDNQTL